MVTSNLLGATSAGIENRIPDRAAWPWVGRRPMISLSKIKLQIPDFEWVSQVSILRPGFLLAMGSRPEHPGLKIETWATHSIFVRAIFITHSPIL